MKLNHELEFFLSGFIDFALKFIHLAYGKNKFNEKFETL